VPSVDLTITTADGESTATLHTPDGEGPWPGVIVYPDAGGPRAAIHDVAMRIAAMGYAALVPDVYYRDAPWAPFDAATAFSDDDERRRMFGLMRALTNENVLADAASYVDGLDARPEVADAPLGTTGYCMGGRFALLTAAARPNRVGAAASFHGGRLAMADDANSPHLLMGAIRAEVLVARAKEDASLTDEQADLLDAALTDAGVVHTIEVYDAHHGYAVVDNPTYDEAAAARHVAALADLYARTLV
jgi:carboxymethylenebutenolidase